MKKTVPGGSQSPPPVRRSAAAAGAALLRRCLLPVLARLNPGDIRLRHPYTGDRLCLHAFRHRNYWLHGARRERATMRFLGAVVRPGWTVFDVGGHIGFLSVYFARLVGPGGTVHVFEPGPDNLHYLRRNTDGRGNIRVVAAGVADAPGRRTLYAEDLSGQNNSFVPEFETLRHNERQAHVTACVTAVPVPVTTLDEFCRETGADPDFVKVDVEGFEREVLAGGGGLIARARASFLVEIQPGHRQTVFACFRQQRYVAWNALGEMADATSPLPDQHAFFCPAAAADDWLARLRT